MTDTLYAVQAKPDLALVDQLQQRLSQLEDDLLVSAWVASRYIPELKSDVKVQHACARHSWGLRKGCRHCQNIGIAHRLRV